MKMNGEQNITYSPVFIDEGHAGQEPPVGHSNGQPTPPKGKKDKQQDGIPWKKTWKKLGEKKKSSSTKSSTQHKVEPLFIIDQDVPNIHSFLIFECTRWQVFRKDEGVTFISSSPHEVRLGMSYS